jgi:hypothetical protein
MLALLVEIVLSRSTETGGLFIYNITWAPLPALATRGCAAYIVRILAFRADESPQIALSPFRIPLAVVL